MTLDEISKGLPNMLKNAHKLSDDERLGNGDANYGSEMLMWLVKQLYEHPEEDPSSVLKYFTANGVDENELAKLLMEEGIEEPVTVTQTTTSVGGIPEAETPEEVGLDAKANGLDDDDALYDAILNGEFDDQLGLAGETTPEEEQMLDQAEKNATEDNSDFSDTDKTSAEEAAEKPAEKPKEEKKEEAAEAPKEDKPAEKKEEKPKEEKPKEDKKDESDDTMKNITSALSDRF